MEITTSEISFEKIVRQEWTSHTTVDAWQKWSAKLAVHTQPLTDAVVRHARLKPGVSVLDLACGTGEPSITIAQMVGAGGRIVSTDLSDGMLEIAEQNARMANIKNIRFQAADVHELPFSDNSFDRVVSRLGLMYFWDVEKALKEVRRVLKPGGIVSFVVWGPVDKNEFLACLLGPFNQRKPMPVPPPDAPTPMRFGDIDKLTETFKQAGFSDIITRQYVEELPWPGTPIELYEHVYEVAVPLQPYFDSFELPERQAALVEIDQELKKVWDGNYTRANGAFNAVCASK